MRKNVLSEILDPVEDGERRNMDVENPFFFIRHPASKHLKVGPRTKQYGLVLKNESWTLTPPCCSLMATLQPPTM